MISTVGKHGMKLSLMLSSAQSSGLYGWSTRSPSNWSALCRSASSCSRLLMTDLIWSLSSITSNLSDVEDRSERILDDGEKSNENSLLFHFSLTQNLRTALGRSPERRSVSSFVHIKEEGNPPKPHIPKKNFWPSFSLISHSEKLSSFGIQNCSLFMIVTQTR